MIRPKSQAQEYLNVLGHHQRRRAGCSEHSHVFKFNLLKTDFINHLPNKSDSIQAKDFHIISVIHSFAKLVAKLMDNRIAPIVPNLLSTIRVFFLGEKYSGQCFGGATNGQESALEKRVKYSS